MSTSVIKSETVASAAAADDTPNAAGRARQREVMWDIQQRLVAHLAAGRTTDMSEAFLELRASIYSDEDRFRAERQKLFESLPLVAGLSCDIPNAGDTLTFDEVGPPILIVRGKDGVVRAFLNRCRHRAARLVDDCGHRARLTCPFHGWTYDLDGKLIGQPVAEGFLGLDRAALSLAPVPVKEWCGLIFVIARAGDDEIDIEAFLSTMAPELAQLDLAAVVPVKKVRLDIGANWKFALDTFFESYHFTTLHPATIAAHAFGNVMVHDQFGPHLRVMVPQHFWQDWVGKPEESWGRVPYQGIHLLFPNTILFAGNLESMQEGSKGSSDRQIFGVWRTFPGETPGAGYSQMATYRPASQDSPQQLAEYENLTDYILGVIAREDYRLCQAGQKNLETSGPDDVIFIGRNESALQSIHREFDARLAAPGP